MLGVGKGLDSMAALVSMVCWCGDWDSEVREGDTCSVLISEGK